jgi:pilus assembly protein CpaB
MNNNGVRVMRGRDSQSVSFGAQNGAVANGMGAAGNAFGSGAVGPLGQP